MIRRTWSVALVLAAAGMLGGASAQAGIVFYDTFKVATYTQLSNAQPSVPAGYFGTVGVSASLPGDLSGGNVTSVSPLSPMTLTGSNGNYSFGTPFVGSKAALDADLPNGTIYTYNLTGGTFNGQSATLATPASDEYAGTVPFFTGSTYNALQGLNPSTAINLTFNTYGTPPGVNTPLTFIGITQVSNSQFVYGTSGDNTLNSATVPGGTLLPNTQYDLDIVFRRPAGITIPASWSFLA